MLAGGRNVGAEREELAVITETVGSRPFDEGRGAVSVLSHHVRSAGVEGLEELFAQLVNHRLALFQFVSVDGICVADVVDL